MGVETEDGGGVEDGEGEEERGEGVGSGFGRGVEERDSGLVPAEGGVEQGGGEEEREGVVGTSFGRGVCESNGEGDEGVGAGEGVAEESGVCFGEEEDGKEVEEGMCAAVVVGIEAVCAADCVYVACAIVA